MNIYVKVNGQNLRLLSNFKIVTGSANFIKMIFTLTSDWDDMLIKAVFTQTVDGETVEHIKTLDNENSCYVPSGLEEGVCMLELYGVGGAGGTIKATSNAIEFSIIGQRYDPSEGGEDEDEDTDGYVATVDEMKAYLGIT